MNCSKISLVVRSVLLCGMAFMFNGCTGDTEENTQEISISSQGCSSMSDGESCSIFITYNGGGTSGLSINVDPDLDSQFSFSDSQENDSDVNCPDTNDSGDQQQCSVTVFYTSNGDNVSQDVSFVVGDATSGSVTLSGD